MSDNNAKTANLGSVFDLPKKSFEIVKNNWQMFVVVNILSVLGALVAIFHDDRPKASGSMNKEDWVLNVQNFNGSDLAAIIGAGALLGLIFFVVSIFLYAMSISLHVRTANGEKPGFNELFEDGKKYVFPLLGLTIIQIVIIVVGLLLLIVPGIIAIGRLAMAQYVMIDKKLGIDESLSESNRLGKKYFGGVWAAVLVLIGVGIVASAIDKIDVVGPLVATALTIAFSLVLVLRYIKIKEVDSGHKKTHKTPAKA